MLNSLPDKVHESYLVIRDDDGWKLIHPTKGPCLIVDHTDIGVVSEAVFSEMVIGNTLDDGTISVMADTFQDIETTKRDLIDDGYTMKELKKMKLRSTQTVTFRA